MTEPLIVRPEIAVDAFLPIFISATLILVFGAVYASVVTLIKMKKIKPVYYIGAYIAWGLQLYNTYYLTKAIHSNPFTIKAMIIVMVAYLIVPHIYFYLIDNSEKQYQN